MRLILDESIARAKAALEDWKRGAGTQEDLGATLEELIAVAAASAPVPLPDDLAPSDPARPRCATCEKWEPRERQEDGRPRGLLGYCRVCTHEKITMATMSDCPGWRHR